jgi:hypothetical protein
MTFAGSEGGLLLTSLAARLLPQAQELNLNDLLSAVLVTPIRTSCLHPREAHDFDPHPFDHLNEELRQASRKTARADRHAVSSV